MGTSLKITVFTWNAEGLSFCKFGEESSKLCTGVDEVTLAAAFSSKVNSLESDIVVFHTQNELRKDSHFHGDHGMADFIMMGSRKYRRELNTAGDGIGQLQSMLTAGTMGKSLSLQTSIYVKKSIPAIAEKKGAIKKFFGASEGQVYHTNLDPVQGALGTMVTLPGRERFLFLNINLANQKLFKGKAAAFKRDAVNKIAFIQIMETFHENLPVEQRAAHIIMSGNFNLPQVDINVPIPTTDVYLKRFIPDVYPYSEGKDNKGPEFPPTDYLVPGRTEKCQDSKSVPVECFTSYSWSERIITHNYSTTGSTLTCGSYERFDFRGMALGKAAGVMGHFNYEEKTRA